ncbi:MAG: ABC transporter permease [Clostridiaceae bacterium]|nr:ABC transporter permease [Clostridiaceae bacterium]
MKFRTIKYMIREGFSNTYKNLLMTLASLTMVVSSLLIFGLFLLVTLILTFNLKQMEKQIAEVVIWLDKDIAPLQADDIELRLKNDERVLKCDRITKEQAFAELNEALEDPSLLKGYTPEFLSESFRLRLKDAGQIDEFAQEMRTFTGVEDIDFPKDFLDKLSLILKWINAGSMFILALLLIISVSIISNTIKLTVYARRREIGIMKYIGATDWFIRWPFIIEGIIIGLVGSVISFVITGYLYNALETYINSEAVVSGMSLIRMLPLKDIGGQVLFVYIIIGVVMGAVGSIISVRKHLNV